MWICHRIKKYMYGPTGSSYPYTPNWGNILPKKTHQDQMPNKTFW